MCNAIEKNTYKTTSQMHPDKITDEDLNFFKQISDNTFDYELTLPFVFNFNRTLRENFIFFLKQVFNTKFKSIDSTNNFSKNLLNNDAGLGDSSKNFQTQLSSSSDFKNNNFTKQNSDPLHTDMLLISRIFFQNLKSKRIGKQNVSLVLVEALYSIKCLYLISNKVTRSNSMCASSIKYTPETHGDKKSRQLGPTFLFRFYCRGDNHYNFYSIQTYPIRIV